MRLTLLKQTGKWCLLILLLLLMHGSQAQTSPGIKIKNILDGAKGQLAKDSAVTVQDSIYFKGELAGKLDTPYQVRNIITFSINEYSNVYLPAAFSATASIRIYYTKPDFSVDSADQSLIINYDTANTYTLRNSFVFNNAHEVKIKVLSVTAATDIVPVLLLENEMEVHPVYKLSCTDDAVKSISSNNPVNADSTDEIIVNWPVKPGADVYDLEWAYIDSSALVNYQHGDTLIPALIFENNTTRVTVSNNSYAIPLLYDNGGVLCYRVRAVQEKDNNVRMETSWSSDFDGGLGAYGFVGHERNLNWQSSITFAEEGKRKVVVQYFDGSLRSRQTVTKDNTTNTTIVAETFYDYQGRPAVNVLPAPSLNNIIKYTRNVNADMNGAEYDKDHYDHIATPAEYLTGSAQQMGSMSGTNQYYSPNNPEKNTGVNKYIPDANGYAFTETEYTQDNTGRIRRQGGVGETFKLGSNHETKYYYSTAAQEDLDALFGTEVGDHRHYFKNMVSDANGQYAVTYQDMHGRTIATALAGSPESGNLSDLPSKEVITVTDSLSGPGTNTVTDLSMSNHHSLPITQDGNVSFKYQLTPPVLKEKNCKDSTINYIGLYDLEISITDDCYNQHLPGGKPFDTILHNYNPFDVGFSLYLLKGSYEITKTLTINKERMDYYRDSVFLKSNVCTTLDKYIADQRIAQRQQSCAPDCKSCRDSIGDWDSFRISYVLNSGNSLADSAEYRGEAWTAYQSALSACNDLCGTTTATNDVRAAMLLDMSGPSGQYAMLSDSSNIYSIFYHKDETVPPTYQRKDITYLDDAGKPALAYDENTNTYVIPQLLSADQFATKFKSSWATALLPFHPEYCKLVQTEMHAASDNWDILFSAVDTYAEAKSNGFLNPTGDANLPFAIGNTDSLFLTRTDLKAKLNTKLTAFVDTLGKKISMWSIATSSVKCLSNDTGCPDTYNTPALAFNESALCSSDLDMAWRTFRELYLNAKRDILNDDINLNCTSVNGDLLTKAGKQVRFNNVTSALVAGGAGSLAFGGLSQSVVQDSSNAAQSRLYDTNCRAYVQFWMQQLAPCNYDSNALKYLTGLMVEVCKQGSDMEHSKGSSTVKPGSTYQYKSFEDVLNVYNAQHKITSGYICNAQLITTPQPYDKQVAYSNITSYAKPDDCQCGKLHDLQLEYQTVKKAADVNLSAYLQRTRGVTISQSDLDILTDACNAGSNSCSWLPKPISIPPLMQCSVAPACVNCAEVNTWYSSFKAMYPGITAVAPANDLDSVQMQKNTLFENYMNNHLGFNKSAWEYMAFMDSCKLPMDGGTVVCKAGPANSNKMVSSYSNGGVDQITDIQRTKDKGYILAGSTTGSGAGGRDAYIIKTDSAGALLWSKTYGGIQQDEFIRLKPTADSGYIAIGNTYSYCYDKGAILIVKIDKDGNAIWNKAIDFGAAYGGKGTDVIQLTDGRYAFSGLRTTSSIGTDWVTGVLSDSGELGWMKQWGSASAKESISLLENKDTLVAATSLMNGADYDVVVLGMNKYTGAMLGMAAYDLESRGNVANNIIKTASGYKITAINLSDASHTSANGAILDVAAGGNVLSAKTVNSPGTQAAKAWATDVASDGGIIAAQSMGSTPQDVYWHKLSADNSVQWSSHVRIDGNDLLYRILWNADGTMAGAGTYNGSSAMLMLATSKGKTGCKDSVESIGSTTITGTLKAVPAQTEVTLGFNNISTIPLFEQLSNPVRAILSCPGLDSCYTIGTILLCGNAEPVFANVDVNTITNCSDSTFFAVSAGRVQYNAYHDSVKNTFNEDYIRTALTAASLEKFAVTYSTSEYHYTLYYYDQAGNLVKTVPPAGVIKNRSASWLDSVKTARLNGVKLVPKHKMATEYRYNTLNAVVAQKTPDAGGSKFWYDRLGRVAVSQNAKQAGVNAYSYSMFDPLGRISEVGELTSVTPISDSISRKESVLTAWMNAAGSSRREISHTVYDESISPFEGELWNATNLRNRVSWSAIYNSAAEQAAGSYSSGTFYSYDIHGNVNLLLQDYKQGGMADAGKGNRWKKIAYQYDLISGKVNTVSYQPGQPDAFYHRYSYDAENRITNVETSKDSIYWENDAFYQYYKHGPLARTVIGQQQVQGLDYAYTLQGWLKGVNSTAVTSTFDMGQDGTSGSMVAKDVFGFALHYYGNGEYSPVNNTVTPFASVTGLTSLFNGNISAISQNLPSLGNPLLYSYNYDVLNRLKKMQASNGLNTATNTWTPIALADYKESISYDANGNILTYDRYGNKAAPNKQMDSLTYSYKTGTNKLDFINDDIAAANYDNDIDNQSIGNYDYDAIGNLVKDSAGSIRNISWNVYGKIAAITKTDGTTISYTYDVAGNRVNKTVNGVQTWYVRDASGNVMSVYAKGDNSINSGAFSQIETHLYGSTRLGINTLNINMESGIAPVIVNLTGLGSGFNINFIRGKKFFELSNHLGNVLATVSDKKTSIFTGSIFDHYEADIVSSQEYYPFGMQMPGRGFSGSKYRYGFNGQEKSDEIAGEGNHNTAEFWEYDTRIGRRWNLDPRPKVWESPYVGFANNPISFSDPLGDTTYRFDHEGAFIESVDLKQAGTKGVIGAYKDFTDAGGKTFKGWVTEKAFDFNDLSIDKGQLDALKPCDLGISFISDGNLAWIMQHSRIRKMGLISRLYFAYEESGGGRMDFNGNYTLPMVGLGMDADGEVKFNDQSGGFVLFDESYTAFNLNDAGQFIWGYAMNKLGFSYSMSVVGSQTNGRRTELEWDTKADQRAIRNGYHYSVKLVNVVKLPWNSWMPSSLNIKVPNRPDAGVFSDIEFRTPPSR